MKKLKGVFLILSFITYAQAMAHSVPHVGIVVHFAKPSDFWPNEFDRGLKQELSQTQDIQWFYFSLLEETKENILNKIIEKKPAFVVLESNISTNTFIADLVSLDIPVFFSALIPSGDTKGLIGVDTNKYTGVYHRDDLFLDGIGFLNKITPLKKIGIVGGNYVDTVALINAAKHQLTVGGYAVEARVENNYEDWKESLLDFSNSMDGIVAFLPFGVKKRNGDLVDWKEAGEWAMANIKKPTLGLASPKGSPMKRTVSLAVPSDKLGQQTACLIYRWLKGEKISQIKAEKFRFVELHISSSEIEKLGLVVPIDLLSFITLD